MANPRKFSEKIALHNQKQAEETAAFEQIMREVSDATSRTPNVEIHPARPPDYRAERGRPGGGPIRQRTAENSRRVDTSPYNSNAYLSPPPDSSWRRTNSDSALHQSAMNTNEATLRSAGSQRGDNQTFGLLDPTDRKSLQLVDGRPRVPGINIYPIQQEPGTIQIPIGNNTGSLPDLTNFHFPPPLQNPLDHEDPNSSPYSTSPQGTSPSTLSPTSLSSRPAGRFSFGGGGGGGNGGDTGGIGSCGGRGGSPQESQGTSPGHSPGTHRRPYHQAHLQNLVLTTGTQPTVANHLSVPSLLDPRFLQTSKGIAVDSGNPLDSFQQNPYLFQQPQQQLQHQQPTQSQQTSPQQSPQPLQQQQQPQQQSPSLLHQQTAPSPQPHQPPSPLQQSPLQQSPLQQQPSPQPQPSSSPNLISNSQSISPLHLNSLNTYRSPPPLSRPSPQTSPGLTVQASSLVYRSNSPGEASHSGPQSPVSPASPPGAGLGSSSPFLEHGNSCGLSPAQAQALQLHFEQFSMVDNPDTSSGYMTAQNNGTQYSQAMAHSPDNGFVQGPQDLPADQVYYGQSPSQLSYSRPVAMNPSGGSTQQTTPQTPNTPSSIPDIILTDFSSNPADDLSRQEFGKELVSAISGSFDSEFSSEDRLLEGLGSIDFEGYQMLTDPELNAITDPATEDTFRMDRL